MAWGYRYRQFVLASEVHGIYLFSWVLERIQALLKNEPELRDAMSQRLIEVLIDEVGHVTYNRLVIGSDNLGLAKYLTHNISKSAALITPELKALGYDKKVVAGFGAFDFNKLPEEVRRRSFFT